MGAPFATLRWTNPSFNAAVDDSGNTYCEIGNELLRDLRDVRIYGQPSYGGLARLLSTLAEIGKEGRPDSAVVDLEAAGIHWHFWIISTDLVGNASCSSNVVYIRGEQITGVTEGPADPIVRVAFFDVRGRLVKSPTVSGVYLKREWYKSGRIVTTKAVFLK